jgi:hypothetical protein
VTGPASLRQWATDRQWEYLEAVEKHGTIRAAAAALGVHHSCIARSLKSVRAKAAIAGHSPEHDMTHTVPDGFRVRGVSTYYDQEGKPRGQWVKSAADDDRRTEILREFVEELCREARGRAPLTVAPVHLRADLLVIYKFGDPHFGMASGPEAGGDEFDTDEADRITRAGIDRLVSVTPNAQTCIVEIIGDAMHANDSSALTPGHKNPLDVDKRGFHHALLVAARAWRYVIERALDKHGEVIVWMLAGNHDPDSAFALALALSFYFESDPRVKIDLGPSVFRYHRFGKCLFGAHHGDRVKMDALPLLMAVDCSEHWGQTVFRYIDTGHIHHDVVKEVGGVRVESLRTLAPKDPYHSFKGYRSLRDTRAAAYHSQFGEVERYTVSAAMLEPEHAVA